MSEARESWRRCVAPVLLLVAATVVAYRPVTTYEFTNYDDQEYVSENHEVRNGLTVDGVVWAFTTGHASNWHPVTWLSHMLDVQIFGLRAGGHHATSLILHVLNAVLLFLLLRGMTGATWRSFFVAALFALHPTHVESVAWVAERKDVLSAFFAMLTVAAYVRYVELPSGTKYAWIFVLLAVGLMTKPMLVTLPFLLLLLDIWPLRRLNSIDALRARVAEKLPLLALAAASSVVTLVVQRKAAASFEAIAFGPRLGNAIVSYGRYLGKTIWPNPLSVFYSLPDAWPIVTVLSVFVLLAALTALLVRWARRAPYGIVGWLWFLGSLVPVIGLVQVGRQSIADRYTYLPSIGILIAIVWGAHELLRARRTTRLAGATLGVVVSCALFALTRQQLATWHDPISLWSHAVAVDPADAIAHHNLGAAEQRLGDVFGAISDFDAAIRLKPEVAEFYDSRGNARRLAGRFRDAISDFDEAIALKPEMDQAYVNRGLARRDAGDLAGAVADYGRAIRLNPRSGEAYNSLGLAHLQSNDLDSAVTALDRAIEVNPHLAEAFNNRGHIRALRSDIPGAMADYDRALLLDPLLVEAFFNRALAKKQSGDAAGALEDFGRALKVQPCFVEALTNRGNLLLTRGDTRAALADYDTGIRCGRPLATTYLGRAVARWWLDDAQGALQDCVKALELDPSLQEAVTLRARLAPPGSHK